MDASIFVGTSKGLYLVNLATKNIKYLPRSHLRRAGINHIAYGDGALLAAVPGWSKVSEMYGYAEEEQGTVPSGCYLVTVDKEGNMSPGSLIWSGDARSCAIYKEKDGHTQTFFVGTEPADVLSSDDEGASWCTTDSFKDLPTRKDWYFPQTPNIPHTLSIDFAPASHGEPSVVMAGIEVGGVVVSTNKGKSWEERNSDLCEDVHSVRPDPFNANRWYAVAGGGKIPGGLFVTMNRGHSWRRLIRRAPYTVGLAISPYKEGELLLTAADRPPGIGVYVFHSLDQGDTWKEIKDEGVKGTYTPVPAYGADTAILGCDDGRILVSRDDRWEQIIQLDGKVNCIVNAAEVGSPSSVMH